MWDWLPVVEAWMIENWGWGYVFSFLFAILLFEEMTKKRGKK